MNNGNNEGGQFLMFELKKSLQDQYAPHNACFGCGPSNPKGLRIKSFVDNDIVIAEWMPEAHHEAFPGILNGGIIGTLLDCHSNWSAAYHLMKAKGLDNPPCTVTAYFNVSLKRPTPSQKKVSLLAKIEEISGEQVLVKANLCSSNLEMSG